MIIIEAELTAAFIVKQQQEVMRFVGDDGISLET